MSLASVAGNLLKPQTSLQQLLEDINFQRTKEMRQMLKDDGGFVVLQGTTYWTDLFVRHFLFQTEPVHSIDSDDLLFFVRKKHIKSSSRHMPKYETEVEVFRKDSRKLPIGDPDVDWEETVYLNMVIHKFDYTLTLAICTRTSPKELQVLRRHSQRVYASPSRRKMDTKGEGEEITYPHICFMVDNFDEVFSDILVRDGEMVCVELVANDKDGAVQGVIFLGSIRYDALKQVYDARQSSLSSKVAQRMSFGLFSSGASVQTRCEFVRMKGPQGKGHAEMAVTKPKGSGVETPTSEPGFCATDMWDDWEEENDDYCTYRHQRRLSDPSANFNNFVRHSWRTKQPTESGPGSVGPGVKARSENEGLDSLANEVSEIEAGDLRDDQQLSAFSASAAKLHINPLCDAQENAETDKNKTPNGPNSAINEATEAIVEDESESTTTKAKSAANKKIGCGNCFSGAKGKIAKKKELNTPEMSEIYCPSCEKDDVANATPECLNKIPAKNARTKPRNILSVESELIISGRGSLRLKDKKPINRSASLSAADRLKSRLRVEKEQQKERKEKQLLKDKEKEKKKLLYKPRDNKDKEKISKTSNLLSKISPKKIRKKVTGGEVSTNTETTRRSRSVSDNNKNSIELLPRKTQTKHLIKDKKPPVKSTKISKEQQEVCAQVYEIADDATSLNGEDFLEQNDNNSGKMAILSDNDKKLMISVHGSEELPQTADETTPTNNNPYNFEKCVPVENRPLKTEEQPITENNIKIETKKDEENNDAEDFEVIAHETLPMLSNKRNSFESELSKHLATLPRSAKRTNGNAQAYYNRALDLVPKRRTKDGTNIYYWCDLPKKVLKELDDGAYNPLWASRGFTQTYHFWKEHRRAQCVPLNAFLTYVTLPWWSIAKDLLDHRETPILTF